MLCGGGISKKIMPAMDDDIAYHRRAQRVQAGQKGLQQKSFHFAQRDAAGKANAEIIVAVGQFDIHQRKTYAQIGNDALNEITELPAPEIDMAQQAVADEIKALAKADGGHEAGR